MLSKEKWKDVLDYEGFYQVSSHGAIKRIAGFINKKNHRNQTSVKWKETLLKQCFQPRGEKTVTLSKNNIRKTKIIHRLIGFAFIPNPKKLPQINHKDLNPSNNHVSNLEWVTPLQNTRHGLLNEVNGKVKLSIKNVLAIRKALAKGISRSKLAKKYKVQTQTIRGIANNKNWRWLK